MYANGAVLTSLHPLRITDPLMNVKRKKNILFFLFLFFLSSNIIIIDTIFQKKEKKDMYVHTFNESMV